jgi:hypothetical protein
MWFGGELATATAIIRKPPDPEPGPEQEPEPEQDTTLRLNRAPWEQAPAPVIPAQPGRDGPDAAGRHRKERGLREVAADALRAAARVPLP